MTATAGQRTVKALSFTQPWATLLAHGRKQIETRDWGTPYRGALAIHAAKGFPAWAKELCPEEPFNHLLWELGFRRVSELPLGAVVGLAVLRSCYQITADNRPTGDELRLGNYTPGRFAWAFEEFRPFAVPVPAQGSPGLWIWTMPESRDGGLTG